MSASLLSSSLSALRLDLAKHVAFGSDPLNRDASATSDSVESFAAVSLAKSFAKKFVGPSEFTVALSDRESAAFREFTRCNDLCGTQLGFQYDSEPLLLRARAIMLDALYKSDLDVLMVSDLARHLRHGPGSSRGVKGTSFLEKIGYAPLTATSECVARTYKSLTRLCGLWSAAELLRDKNHGVRTYAGSLLGFAPKAYDRERVRMTECSANMALQLSLGELIWGSLNVGFGIFKDKEPDHNRALARLGSKSDHEYSYSTIDLTSASDLIRKDLVCWFLAGTPLLQLLLMTRSDVCEFKGTHIPLNMFATMGNGFTFPLQTLIFTCLVVAMYESLGIRTKHRRVRTFGVFGDDIIVVRRAFDPLCQLLFRLGMEVNTSKSFSEGDFRESCGTDWYRGVNVRGVYIKSLSSNAEVLSAINRLNDWSCRHNILLCRTIKSLRDSLGPLSNNAVPFWEDDMAGVKVPIEFADLCGLKLPPVSQTVRLTLGATQGSIVYTRFRPSVKAYALTDKHGNVRPGKLVFQGNRLCRNIPAVLASLIGGYIKSGCVTIRQEAGSHVRYRSELGVAPCWGYPGSDQGTDSFLGRSQYGLRNKVVYLLNLGL